VNPHLRRANSRFAIVGGLEWYRVAQVVFRTEMSFHVEMTCRAEMASDLLFDDCIGLVKELPYLCASSVSGDSSLSHFGEEDSGVRGSDESLPGVFTSQSSPFYAPDTEHTSSSLLWLQHKVP
jgi:hypothetical protein